MKHHQVTLDIRKGKYRFQQGGFTDKENNAFASFEPKHKVRVGGFMTLMTPPPLKDLLLTIKQ